MKKAVVIISLIILLMTACNSQKTIIESPEESIENSNSSVKPFANVKDVAGKTEEEVSKILGKPILTKDSESFTKNYYLEMKKDFGRVEILFIDGRARHIVLYLFGEEYNKTERNSNLAYLGLPSNADLIHKKIAEVRDVYYVHDFEGFYKIEIEDWTDTVATGSVRVVTQEKYT